MTKPLVNFILGLFAGAILSALVLAHLVAARVDAHEREMTQLLEQQRQAFDGLTKATAAWQDRALVCEKKFTTGTVVLEPHPVAELPLFHGVASLSVNAGELRPSWFIPAQVRVYTNVPGARYQWQDMRTGELRGEFAALPPSAMGQTQAVQ